MAKVQPIVKLPSGPLIPYLAFCKAIAEAVGPKYKNLEGIDCVSDKIYPPGAWTPIPGVQGPYSLDDADRQALSKVLVELPRLHYPMSEKEIALFMDAYERHQNRPVWTPLLVNKETIRQHKFEFNRIEDQHLESLRQEHRAGRLVPVGTNHVPLNAVQMGAHLTRKDAIAFLERHGLAHDDEKTVTGVMQEDSPSPTVEQSYSDEETVSGLMQEVSPAPTVGESHGGEETVTSLTQEDSSSHMVGKAILSPSDRKEIVKRYFALRNEGRRNFADLTAKEFGVSVRWVSSLVKKAKEKKR